MAMTTFTRPTLPPTKLKGKAKEVYYRLLGETPAQQARRELAESFSEAVDHAIFNALRPPLQVHRPKRFEL